MHRPGLSSFSVLGCYLGVGVCPTPRSWQDGPGAIRLKLVPWHACAVRAYSSARSPLLMDLEIQGANYFGKQAISYCSEWGLPFANSGMVLRSMRVAY